MTFYLKPPRGCMQLAGVEKITWRRLKFLLGISRCNHNVISMKELVQQAATVADSDCLIEGSQKDLVSHFLIRLVCAQDREMETFFLRSEAQLFSYRFSCMNSQELRECVKPLRRFLRSAQDEKNLCEEYKCVLAISNRLTERYDWTSIIDHFVNSDGGKYLNVPFVYVLDLVRRRAVVLDRGVARVPSTKLGDVITTIFSTILIRGMEQARHVLPTVMDTDDRIAKLFRSIQAFFHKHHKSFHSGHSVLGSSIRCEDIDNLVDMYPPCMSHLHRQLRLKHRIRHFSRIQYTLYLKEMGLPIHEALQFWMQEYAQESTQNASNKHGCHHNWRTDGRRYTYNIRHLYGLEGNRINYRGHCCGSIQNQALSHGDEGGCPFKHFDKQHLIQELSLGELPLDDVRNIMMLSGQDGCYNEACRTYMKAKLQKYAERNKVRFGTKRERIEKCDSGAKCYKYQSLIGKDHEMPITRQYVRSDGVPSSEEEDVENQNIDIPTMGDKNSCQILSGVNFCQSHDKVAPVEYQSEVNCKCLPDARKSDVFSSQLNVHFDVPNASKSLRNQLISDLNLTQRRVEISLTDKYDCSDGDDQTQTLGCFDHRTCPSSQQSTHQYLSHISIHKPIDYFVTYNALLDGMK